MAVPVRAEQNALAVGCPAENFIGARVVCQTLWYTAISRDYVNIAIAIVITSKCNLSSVGGEHWAGLHPHTCCDTACVTSFTRHDPQVAGVAEGNQGLADGWLPQEVWLAAVCHAGEGETGTQEGKNHLFHDCTSMTCR